MTQIFLTVLFVLAMSMLTFAASIAEGPVAGVAAQSTLHD